MIIIKPGETKQIALFLTFMTIIVMTIYVSTTCVYEGCECLYKLKCGNATSPTHRVKWPVKKEWNSNPFIQMLNLYARSNNASNCWVCSHLHPHTGMIPMMAVPFSFSSLNETYIQVVFNITKKKDKLVGLKVTQHVSVPQICLNLSCPPDNNINCRNVGRSNCTGAKVIIHTGDGTGNYYSFFEEKLKQALYTTNCTLFPICHNLGVLRFYVLASHIGGTTIPSIKRELYLICGSQAYAWLPANISGLCYLGKLSPILAVVPDTEQKMDAVYYPH